MKVVFNIFLKQILKRSFFAKGLKVNPSSMPHVSIYVMQELYNIYFLVFEAIKKLN